jgi:hypothetical protein
LAEAISHARGEEASARGVTGRQRRRASRVSGPVRARERTHARDDGFDQVFSAGIAHAREAFSSDIACARDAGHDATAAGARADSRTSTRARAREGGESRLRHFRTHRPRARVRREGPMRRIGASATGTSTHARALRRLAPRYGWSPGELVEIQAQVERRPELMERYWRNLAVAYEAGFVQLEKNGFLTIRAWCAETGRCDPMRYEIAK